MKERSCRKSEAVDAVSSAKPAKTTSKQASKASPVRLWPQEEGLMAQLLEPSVIRYSNTPEKVARKVAPSCYISPSPSWPSRGRLPSLTPSPPTAAPAPPAPRIALLSSGRPSRRAWRSVKSNRVPGGNREKSGEACLEAWHCSSS